MNPVVSSLGYDYIILDKNGHRGVKDGKEFPISEEEWQRAHPEHRNVDCKECTFVADLETLLTFFVPRETRARADAKPVFVGKFTMAKWAGHSGFYLFKCQNCDSVCVDYPHGYTDGGCLFLRCDHCRLKIVLTPRRYKEVYETEKVVAPPTLWQELKLLWRNRPTREQRKRLGQLYASLDKTKQESNGGQVYGSPYVITDPTILSSRTTEAIETVDSNSFGPGSILDKLRGLRYEIIFWALLAYALVYGIFRLW